MSQCWRLTSKDLEHSRGAVGKEQSLFAIAANQDAWTKKIIELVDMFNK